MKGCEELIYELTEEELERLVKLLYDVIERLEEAILNLVDVEDDISDMARILECVELSMDADEVLGMIGKLRKILVKLQRLKDRL